MSPSLALTHIALRVSDLQHSVRFYADQVGFVIVNRSEATVDLATSPDVAPLLRLIEIGNRPAPHTAAGLFHAALLFPNRAALAAWLRGAAERHVEFDGFSDHLVSEAIYFADPDGNGLEFYADRPRDQWPLNGSEVEMVTRPLDLPSLLGAAKSSGATPLTGAVWGHVHLRVTDLDRSEAWYREQLGMAVMQRNYPGARFLAADGYHHHVGMNIWGRPRQSQPPDTIGLASATFARRGESQPREFSDPDQIRIRVEPLTN